MQSVCLKLHSFIVNKVYLQNEMVESAVGDQILTDHSTIGVLQFTNLVPRFFFILTPDSSSCVKQLLESGIRMKKAWTQLLEYSVRTKKLGTKVVISTENPRNYVC